MGDLACIVAENLVLYLTNSQQKGTAVRREENFDSFLESDWVFYLTRETPTRMSDFLVGDQEEGCIESHMVQQIKQNINQNFKNSTKNGGFSLVEALEQGKAEKVIEQVEVASKLLEGLSTDIYTPLLRQLKDQSQVAGRCQE